MESDGVGISRLDLSGPYLKYPNKPTPGFEPPDLSPYLEVEYLSFARTSLNTLPSDVARMTRLKVLNLSECKSLTSLPDAIGGLVSLEKIVLTSSAISRFP